LVEVEARSLSPKEFRGTSSASGTPRAVWHPAWTRGPVSPVGPRLRCAAGAGRWPGRAVPDEHLGELLAYQLLVEHGVTSFHKGHSPPVAVAGDRLNLNHLGEDEDRGDVFGLSSEVLILLGAVNSPQAYLFGLPVVQHGHRVTVGHAYDLAGPCAAGRRQAEEKCRDNSGRQSSSQRDRSPHLVTSPGNGEARNMPLSC
jgi:hypothetical protein